MPLVFCSAVCSPFLSLTPARSARLPTLPGARATNQSRPSARPVPGLPLRSEGDGRVGVGWESPARAYLCFVITENRTQSVV